MSDSTINLFASAASAEFKSYREGLFDFVTRPGVVVKEQRLFIQNGQPILILLDDYIAECNAVIHLLGDRTGNEEDHGFPGEENLTALFSRHPTLLDKLNISEAEAREISYTQWEAYLAIFHGVDLFIATPTEDVVPDEICKDESARELQATSQKTHLARLQRLERFPAFEFESLHHLCLQVYRHLYDLLPQSDTPIAPSMPPSLGSLFKGRDKWLARIREAIRSGKSADAVRVVVHGMGGLGKTQLAAEYAYACAHEHSALLIVSGETAESLNAGLSDLCGVLKLPQSASKNEQTRIKATVDWLDKEENRGWLLIVDNADNKDHFKAVTEFVTQRNRGHVLLTSRIDRWPNGFVPLKLDLLDPESAKDYLLEATEKFRVSSATDSNIDAESELAATIADSLGYLALGLVQAAGTIKTLRLSFADYLAKWETNRDELLDDPDFDPDLLGYPRTVAMTWLTSYQQLPAESKLVFDILCWFAHEPIPERIITGKWHEDVLELIEDEDLRETIQSKQTRLMVPLYDFSLTESPIGPYRLFQIHRLVQEVGRIWQRKDSDQPVTERMMQIALEREFVRPDDIDNIRQNIYSELRPLFLHVEYLLENHAFIEDYPFSASRLSCMMAELLKDSGQLLDALSFADDSLVLAETLTDTSENLFALSEALSIKSQVLVDRGSIDAALEFGNRQRTVCQRRLAKEPDNLAHQRDLAIALENVGRVLQAKGELEQALELFNQSREIGQTLCDKEPDNLAHQRDLAIALENVGRVLEAKGELEQALELFNQSREIRQTLCDKEPDNLAHQRDLAIALENAGRVLQAKGELAQALELFNQSREIGQKLCDKEPDNLAHQRDLAITLHSLGGCERSLKRFGRAIESLKAAARMIRKLMKHAGYGDLRHGLNLVQEELRLARQQQMEQEE
ncbi:MAG: tetratricopeptide repeat protein [Planctomycetota bacterium]